MRFIELDLQDEFMLTTLYPLYQNYEAEISGGEVEDFFPIDEHEDNFEDFLNCFKGCTTYICVIDEEYKGFVNCHMDSEERPGYAKGYNGWGHMSDIYVDKQSRGLGIGKLMVRMAEKKLSEYDKKGIYLTDLSGKGFFWESLGYIDTGKTEPNGGQICEKYV